MHQNDLLAGASLHRGRRRGKLENENVAIDTAGYPNSFGAVISAFCESLGDTIVNGA